MNKAEANKILNDEIQRHMAMDYDQLASKVDHLDAYEIQAGSGVKYQLETQVFWDVPSKPEGDLRVLIAIDDGSLWSALKPLSADFIMTPEGNIPQGQASDGGDD